MSGFLAMLDAFLMCHGRSASDELSHRRVIFFGPAWIRLLGPIVLRLVGDADSNARSNITPSATWGISKAWLTWEYL